MVSSALVSEVADNTLPAHPGLRRRLADALARRWTAAGGVSPGPQHPEARPDGSAWAALALAAEPGHEDRVASARAHLARVQGPDGRVAALPDRPETAWPTALAAIAWQGAEAYAEPRARAVAWLTGTQGRVYSDLVAAEQKPLVWGDGTLRGWPWIQDTYAWNEPTALAMLALRLAGRGAEGASARVREGVTLALDRQRPNGGWTYGHAAALGSELIALPSPTGALLSAIAGLVPRAQVEMSLDWVRHEAARVRTPLSLSWCVLGLAGFGVRPRDADARLDAAERRQAVIGPYDTESLALLLLAHRLVHGWMGAQPAPEATP